MASVTSQKELEIRYQVLVLIRAPSYAPCDECLIYTAGMLSLLNFTIYWGISIDSDGHRSQGSKFPKFFGRSQAAEGLSELPRNVTSEKRPIFVQIWQVLGAKSEKFRRSQTASAPSEPRNPDGEVTGHRPSESIEIPQ